MRRSWILIAVACLACSVDVGDDNDFASGGSAGMSATATAASSSTDDGETSAGEATDGESASTTATTTTTPTTTDTNPSTTTDPTSSDPTTTSGSASSSTSEDTGSTSSSQGGDLDPDLDVPDRGAACTTPGSLGECPGSEVCRFHTAEEGRCESCDACGNLNAPCVEGTDCDIVFVCYAGRCTNFCPLGTKACGPPDACLDVGHPTHGVCDPFA